MHQCGKHRRRETATARCFAMTTTQTQTPGDARDRHRSRHHASSDGGWFVNGGAHALQFHQLVTMCLCARAASCRIWRQCMRKTAWLACALAYADTSLQQDCMQMPPAARPRATAKTLSAPDKHRVLRAAYRAYAAASQRHLHSPHRCWHRRVGHRPPRRQIQMPGLPSGTLTAERSAPYLHGVSSVRCPLVFQF
ncbi:hypothetical protein FHY19_000177 [Xanthomonas arboricola]|nr:hypothetical protein [Xanthomonas sp. 4461]